MGHPIDSAPREETIHPKRVAVTGIGVLSPNGIGREKYWSAIVAGESGVKRIKSLEVSRLRTKIAAEIQDFDPGEVLPEEDPLNVWRAIPLMLYAAGEALEDSGLRPRAWTDSMRRRIGVVIGTGGRGALTERAESLSEPKSLVADRSRGLLPHSSIGALSAELSVRFALNGPSHVITTGWTSSTDAIGYANQWIRMGEMDFVVTGGVEAPITPSVMRGLEKAGLMPTEWNDFPALASRPFDRGRSGFVLSEGAWLMVLEDLEAALRRGARIWGELIGYASTFEGTRSGAEGLGMESARAMSEALAKAGLGLDEIDYVQLHGDSSPETDRAEARAVKRCLGPRACEIPMSSVKSMIGHPQGACGAAGAVAALMAIHRGIIPPTINLDEPDPDCDLNYVSSGAVKKRVRAALCNTLGANSKNSALVFSSPRGLPVA